MADLFLLSEAQMGRLSPHFPLAHGVPRVDDRRVVSGIVYVIRNGLQWKDAPKGYGPHKTLYNRFIRKRSADGVRLEVPWHKRLDIGCRPALNNAGQGLR